MVDTSQGQHIALSLAAHLARSQLVRDPLARYDTQHLFEMLDAVAYALLKSARLHVRELDDTAPRELTPSELEGAAVLEGGRFVLLANGQKLSTVSILRSELRQAIAVLRTLGVPELRIAPQKALAARRAEPPDVAACLDELEELLRPPLLSPQLECANRILILLARHAKGAQIANLAMQLMSALYDSRGNDAISESVPILLARLGMALRQSEDLPT